METEGPPALTSSLPYRSFAKGGSCPHQSGIQRTGMRGIEMGVVPSWAIDPSIENPLINTKERPSRRNQPFGKPLNRNDVWSWPMTFINEHGKGTPENPMTFALMMVGLLLLPDYGNGWRNRNQP